jgi:hypothetical protein
MAVVIGRSGGRGHGGGDVAYTEIEGRNGAIRRKASSWEDQAMTRDPAFRAAIEELRALIPEARASGLSDRDPEEVVAEAIARAENGGEE